MEDEVLFAMTLCVYVLLCVSVLYVCVCCVHVCMFCVCACVNMLQDGEEVIVKMCVNWLQAGEEGGS